MDRTMDLTYLKGIGAKTAALFAKAGAATVGELLEYFPRDYDKLENTVCVEELAAGTVQAVRAYIVQTAPAKSVRNLKILNLTAADGTGRLELTFFNMPYLKSSLKQGKPYIFRGLVKQRGNVLIMEQPKIYEEADYELKKRSLQPLYPLTAGLSNQMVSKAVRQALDLQTDKQEFLPESILQKYDLMNLEQALFQIHFPESGELLRQARRRLVFDEFLIFMLQVQRLKQRRGLRLNHMPMTDGRAADRLLEKLPYALTGAQKRVWEEIKADLSGKAVMNRLIQGDVGSGKTIVALLALLQCVSNDFQGALMAPTEVLAKQHFEQVLKMTEEFGLPFRAALLTGSVTKAARREIYSALKSGEINLVIGTHALIQEKASYHNLGLVVTDEQHRFGVRQREALAGKGDSVHVLVMSATPIPRTLAIILYGDLDISVIDELPADRLAVKNCVVGQAYRKKAYEFIEKEVSLGRQAYVICPMVEEGEAEGLENVTDYSKKLQSGLSGGIKTAPLHGKMPPAQKNRVMEEFAAGRIDVLVSTTVIEVGINVPNATVMLIENAERFGLAQLHQLRGRVGRGKDQSYCIFISGSDSRRSMERLGILNRSNDGFYIAGEDLKLRGPGDLFGIRQSGILDFKLGDIYTDAGILKEAGECAKAVLEAPEEDYGALQEYLNRRERKGVDFHSL